VRFDIDTIAAALGHPGADSEITVSTRPWDDLGSLNPSPKGSYARVSLPLEDFFSNSMDFELWYEWTADARARSELANEVPAALQRSIVDLLALWSDDFAQSSSHEFIAAIPPPPSTPHVSSLRPSSVVAQQQQQHGAVVALNGANGSGWQATVRAASAVEDRVMRLRCEDGARLIPSKFPSGVCVLLRRLPGSPPVAVTLMCASDGDALGREVAGDAESYVSLPSGAFARVWTHWLRSDDEVVVVPDGFMVALRSSTTCTAYVSARWVVPAPRGALNMVRNPWPGLDRADVATGAAQRLLAEVECAWAHEDALRAVRPCLAYLVVEGEPRRKAECRALVVALDEACDRSKRRRV